MEHIHDLSAKLQKGDFAYLGGVFGDGLALFRFEHAREIGVEDGVDVVLKFLERL